MKGNGTTPLIDAGWPVAVVDDASGMASLLAGKLVSSGVNAFPVTSADLPAGTRGVIFLGALRSSLGRDAFMHVNREAFRYAHAFAQLQPEDTSEDSGGIFISVQDTGGDFGLSGISGERAWSGGLPGLIKTAALEWPHIVVKAIDLECGGRSLDDLADCLAEEILGAGRELEVGLHADGRRTRLSSLAVDLPPRPQTDADLPIDSGSVVIASGGARGVTAASLIALARRAQPRIALLGRTPLIEEPGWAAGHGTEEALKRAAAASARVSGQVLKPKEIREQALAILHSREVRATIAALAQAGSKAMYFAVNIEDADSVRSALASVRERWGAIHGIVHGAGLLADKLIRDKTPDQFERVFGVKVEGLCHLLDLTQEDPLRVICLFSSVAARVGNSGQSDYAMANEVLNKVACAEARRRGPSCVVKSLNWGPWDGGMVTPALKAHFDGMGVPLIPVRDGTESFVDEIQHGSRGDVEIVLGGDPAHGLGARG